MRRRGVMKYTLPIVTLVLMLGVLIVLCVMEERGMAEEPPASVSDAMWEDSVIPAFTDSTQVETTAATEEAHTRKDVLTGKTIVYDGDSICMGYSADGGYPALIASATGGSYDNQAVGGGRLCAHSELHSVVNNLENLPTDGDLYCFQGGINDFWANTKIGECSSTDYTGWVDTTTICGAMETIFRYAQTNFADRAVCFVITHKVQDTSHVANANGDTFEDYRNAMVLVCEKYSIPYYDAFSESGLNGEDETQSNAYLTGNSAGTADGIHPNVEGYKKYYVPQLLDLFRRMMATE